MKFTGDESLLKEALSNARSLGKTKVSDKSSSFLPWEIWTQNTNKTGDSSVFTFWPLETWKTTIETWNVGFEDRQGTLKSIWFPKQSFVLMF